MPPLPTSEVIAAPVGTKQGEVALYVVVGPQLEPALMIDAAGGAKFGWLKMLKISPLSWRVILSLILVIFVREISVSAYPGPTSTFLPRLPAVPYCEGTKQASLNHCVTLWCA